MKNTSLWILIFILGIALTKLFFDAREINELTKEKLRLDNEKLRIEIQILERK